MHAPVWFGSDLDSVMILNRNLPDSDQNPNRIAVVSLNSNQSKDRPLAAGRYVPCPGLLWVAVRVRGLPVPR